MRSLTLFRHLVVAVVKRKSARWKYGIPTVGRIRWTADDARGVAVRSGRRLLFVYWARP